MESLTKSYDKLMRTSDLLKTFFKICYGNADVVFGRSSASGQNDANALDFHILSRSSGGEVCIKALLGVTKLAELEVWQLNGC